MEKTTQSNERTKMTEQERKQAKIERLKWLQKQYIKMQLGASKEEKVALRCESAVLAKRLEVAQRGGI